MKRSNLLSTVVLFIGGALTTFLWFPLLPIVVPLVTIALGIKWASANLLSEARFGEKVLPSKLLYFPSTKQHISPSQASRPTAWPSSASLSYPAGADSLPSFNHGERTKSFKRQLREHRQVTRVLNGLDLRRSAPAHS